MRKLAKEDDLSDGIHVIKFFATWCGPCKLYASVFERAESRHPHLNFYEADVDSEEVIERRHGVLSVPTTVIVKDGVEIARVGGALSSKRLDALLTGVLLTGVLRLQDVHST